MVGWAANVGSRGEVMMLQTFCLHCFTMVERIRCRAGEYFFSDYYCQECGGGPLVIVASDFYD